LSSESTVHPRLEQFGLLAISFEASSERYREAPGVAVNYRSTPGPQPVGALFSDALEK